MTAAEHYARYAQAGRAYFARPYQSLWLARLHHGEAEVYALCCSAWVGIQLLHPDESVADVRRLAYARTYAIHSGETPEGPCPSAASAHRLTDADEDTIVRLRDDPRDPLTFEAIAQRFGAHDTTIMQAYRRGKRRQASEIPKS